MTVEDIIIAISEATTSAAIPAVLHRRSREKLGLPAIKLFRRRRNDKRRRRRKLRTKQGKPRDKDPKKLDRDDDEEEEK